MLHVYIKIILTDYIIKLMTIQHRRGCGMFRAYAHFSVNHPLVHKFNLLAVLSIFFVSCYELLVNESIIFSLGFVLVAFPMLVFAKASDYKNKYLSAKN
ncbi:conserved hypothetical protein [Photobacterium profundum SS9]|uniref:Uncharacterized protein n=1 Tax=Photobacterium profundum (strain SS9) TaxID=298386 RepID=Q6LNQ5_PHOPR|nr:conserved hypothetical protein [Photobacterium profundum SS9]